MKWLFIIVCFLFFSACGIFDSGSDHIAGDYYLSWIDTHRNRYIHKKDGEGVVGEMVFAVGHDDRFIWARQAPYHGDDNGAIRDPQIFFVIEQTEYFVQDKPV
ncbi:MAG: hypothetical protein J7497_09385 [Chitinophagaceae bacterium]|nr:hypothetical protein [Chitinophagaceae bacterium]